MHLQVAQGYLGKPDGGWIEAEERLVPSEKVQVLRSETSRLGPFVVLTGMGATTQEQRA